MASVDVSQLSKQEHDELCCAYAALLLHDGELEITVSVPPCLSLPFQGDKLAKVIKASGNEIEPYWPSLFAKALKGQNIEELLSNIGSAPVAAGPVSVAPAAEEKGAKKEGTDFQFS